jgi:tetratricopeptide (TPR) repeat protein
MLAYVFVFTEGGANRKSVLISGFFLAVSVIFLKFFWMKLFDYSLYRAVFLSIKGNISPLSSFAAYVNTVFLSFFHYLKLVVLPYNLSVDYSIKIYKTLFNLKFFVSVVILGLILAKARKSEDKALKFLVLFALIAYLPVSNLIPLVNTAADRYLYFPLVGISAVLSIVLLNVARSSFRGIPAGVLLMSMLVFLYGFKTVRRNAVYRDMKTLYTDALSKYPDNPRVHLNLAYVFIAQKQWQKAAGELEKTEELNPLYMRSEVWHLKGLACEMLGDYDEAKRNYSKVLRTSPRQDTMRSYAGILMRENKEEDAVRFLKKSVENNPDSDSYNKIGVYYAKKKEYKQAISYFEKAVNTDASSVKAWMNLISTYEAMGMKQAADKKANEMAEVFARNKWKLYGRSKYEE